MALIGVAVPAAATTPSIPGPSFTASFDVRVLGGVHGVAQALGMPPPPRAVFLPSVARRIYGLPQGSNDQTDRLLGQLQQYVETAARFESALAAVQPAQGGISLAQARQRDGRKRLDAFLDLIGLDLRERNRAFTVAPVKGKDAAERLRLLASLMIDPAALALRLNAGETVRVTVPVDVVPIAYDSSTWSRVIFQETVADEQLFAAIMADRRAALLATGLAWLDDGTLLFLARNPAVLRRIYEEHATVFAAFGRAVHISEGRVVLPGGSVAVPMWEKIVGERVTRPERFVPDLLAKHDGRVAYLVDAISSLDEAHVRFALGLWIEDPAVRLDRFGALVEVNANAYAEYKANLRPFHRPPMDLGILLSRIRVNPSGVPIGPAWRRLWDTAFDGFDLPDEPDRLLDDYREDGAIDAAWIAGQILHRDAVGRTERLELLSFAQRVFAETPEPELPDVLIALRGFARLKTLMLTLDRLGIRAPSTYAAAAHRAVPLASLERHRAFVALAQFQSALAVVTRLRLAHVIDGAAADTLVRALIAIDLDDGRYRGGIARWLDEDLRAAVAGSDPSGAADEWLVGALAGHGSTSTAARAAEFQWEGRRYRIDLAGAEQRRLMTVRMKQGGHRLDEVLALAREFRRLVSLEPSTSSVADVQRASLAIKAAAAPFSHDREEDGPPGTEPHDVRKNIERTLKSLSSIKNAKDVRKVKGAVEPLVEACDDLLADVLLSYAYALAVGDPGGTVLLGRDPARRHDFGFLEHDDEDRLRAPWRVPAEQAVAGSPWFVKGSVLALDVGLSSLALRRISSDTLGSAPAALNGNDRQTITDGLALLNPFDLDDAERDAVAAALARGRARLRAVATEAELGSLFTHSAAWSIDGLRRRAAQWSVTREPGTLEQWWSAVEILRLGEPPDNLRLDTWGTSGVPLGACLCTQFPAARPWHALTGQSAAGLLPTNLADLNLRVAELSAESGTPAVLARAILAAAVQDYLMEVHPADPDDWLAFLVPPRALTRERFDDYVATLAADGTLAPVDGTQGPGGTRR